MKVSGFLNPNRAEYKRQLFFLFTVGIWWHFSPHLHQFFCSQVILLIRCVMSDCGCLTDRNESFWASVNAAEGLFFFQNQYSNLRQVLCLHSFFFYKDFFLATGHGNLQLSKITSNMPSDMDLLSGVVKVASEHLHTERFSLQKLRVCPNSRVEVLAQMYQSALNCSNMVT